MADFDTLSGLLLQGAKESSAIGAPDTEPLRYHSLRELAERTVAALNAMGIGRNDGVAMMLANGPLAAAAFVAIASGATAAPLNPGYREDELDFYLRDLRPRALVVEAGVDSPARAVAAALAIPIVELRPDGAGAGSFRVEPLVPMHGTAALPGSAGPDDVALLLHTSGTTSRPKLVPLTQRNIASSARHIQAAVALEPGDVCLNIMPLFHIHGLMAPVLASLAAGAEVCCTSGFNALRFFHWLDEVRPTWTSAVPTMHRAILARAERNPGIVGRRHLRFIRSSSASLPARLMADMESVFGAPVIESYGMTEAAHQMASNPLPPRARKPGHVGLAAGPEVAVMDEQGTLVAVGESGEVVVRGPNVTSGYLDNPEANADAFTNGWFRTGDQGLLDGEGYLRLTGRLKELINRGGEKFSPLEVDAVLLEHPAVHHAVAFAVPHEKLGEDVAAAVVLREGHSATERELRDHAALHLAHFKVPHKILLLPELPKGPTGKLLRIGLAAKLGLAK
jgi:acyl-CoA synthetase (AMP-forming)/AMP-acid ligase II